MYSIECGQGEMCPSWPKEVQERSASASPIFSPICSIMGTPRRYWKPKRLQNVNQINPE